MRGSAWTSGDVLNGGGLNKGTDMASSIASFFRTFVIAAGALLLAAAGPAAAQTPSGGYSAQEIVDAGHQFFGATSGALATVVERVFRNYGVPNGYVLGQEASGAFIGGLTYGEGTLYTKNAGDHKLFWQGPSIGWDFGGDGVRTMMLVYKLDSIRSIYGRFGGVSGSAYLIAGAGFHVMERNGVLLVPIYTGVGARLGVNIGYLKVTPMPTWNPF